jgi:hypothetical protein
MLACVLACVLACAQAPLVAPRQTATNCRFCSSCSSLLTDWLRVSSAGSVLFVGEHVRRTLNYILSVRAHGLVSRCFLHWKRRASSSALVRCCPPPPSPIPLPTPFSLSLRHGTGCLYSDSSLTRSGFCRCRAERKSQLERIWLWWHRTLHVRQSWRQRRKVQQQALVRRALATWHQHCTGAVEMQHIRERFITKLHERQEQGCSRRVMLAWRCSLLLSRQTKLLLSTPCAVWMRRSAVALVWVPARAFIAWVTFTSMSLSHRDVCASLISNIKARAALAARQRKLKQQVFLHWRRLKLSPAPALLVASSLRRDKLPSRAITSPDGRHEETRREALTHAFSSLSLFLTPKAAKSAGQNKRKNENVTKHEVERRVQLELGRQDATSRQARRGEESDGWSEGETLEDKVERLKSSVLNAMMPHEEHIEGEIHREQLLLLDALSASIGSQV